MNLITPFNGINIVALRNNAQGTGTLRYTPEVGTKQITTVAVIGGRNGGVNSDYFLMKLNGVPVSIPNVFSIQTLRTSMLSTTAITDAFDIGGLNGSSFTLTTKNGYPITITPDYDDGTGNLTYTALQNANILDIGFTVTQAGIPPTGYKGVLTWQSPNDTVGASVSVKTGIQTVISGNGTSEIVVNITPQLLPDTPTIADINIPTSQIITASRWAFKHSVNASTNPNFDALKVGFDTTIVVTFTNT
ncbi:hypothetical protein [Beggiatoa leptomitoformis]|uniref:Uncharacterized protein n=1 Tax=Beggiatoa leptomitoformis TaxID=288004 RepID=A0A2N9YFS4_9GAMM|nr:hypothetical protein [Beggiatoa leptomitoformis]ALG68339.1 hypothetical protein AL038_12235 [Beggiatoa leptomitoformis]AUI69344.1 hypothetical protein BLE401_12030 [Beggiatoa leptomitoformis]